MIDIENKPSKETTVDTILEKGCSSLKSKMNDKSKTLTPRELSNLLESIVKLYLENNWKMEYNDMKKISKRISIVFPNESRVSCIHFKTFYISRF